MIETNPQGAGRSAGRGREAVSGAAARSVQGNGGVGAPPLRKDGKLQLTTYSNQAKSRHRSGLLRLRQSRVLRRFARANRTEELGSIALLWARPSGNTAAIARNRARPLTPTVSADILDCCMTSWRPRSPASSAQRALDQLYEKRIKQAGYLGYWVNHHSSGYTRRSFSR